MGILFKKSGKIKKWSIALLIILMITIVLMLIWPKTSKLPDSVKNIADMEMCLQKHVDLGNPPGMSMVVVKNDSIIYSKGFGWADRPRKMRATPESVYHWYSITKIVTAIAILQLQEQGKLQLDDSVAKFLPFFKVQYPSATSRTLTIRNLLNHSSGLPDAHPFRLTKWIHLEGESHFNQTELLEKVLPDYSKLEFEPGEETKYTNIGPMVLGAIIEKVTNQTYENYVRQSILEPLEMKHTDFVYTKEMEPFEAGGAHPVFSLYTPVIPFICWSVVREISGNQIWFKRVYNDQTPPSGLIGSAMDIARLAIAYLNNGEIEGRRIFSEQLIHTMTYESHINRDKSDPKAYCEQGIGWQVYNRDRLILQHEGGGFGFRTLLRLYPEEKLGFILFTNDATYEGWRIIDLVATLNW
jgi:CubicO group peptidase (beta-lactamase class C family)